MKGEVEKALEGLGFASLDIVQPGLLLGFRKEMRPLELLAILFMPLINPLLTGSRARSACGVGARWLPPRWSVPARSGRRGVYRYTWTSLAAARCAEAGAYGAGQSEGTVWREVRLSRSRAHSRSAAKITTAGAMS